MINRSLIYLFFFTFLSACQPETPNIIDFEIPNQLKFIGHKGSGPMNKFEKNDFLDNSWESIANAMYRLDGSEIDIQMSKDKTLWLFHDTEIKNCDGELVNFALLTDNEINLISQCNYQNKLIKLSYFASRSHQEDWKNKILCFDMKLLFNEEAVQLFDDGKDYINFVKNEIIQVAETTDFDIRCEVFTDYQYEVLSEVFPDKIYRILIEPTREYLLEKIHNNMKVSVEINHAYNLLKDTTIQVPNLWVVNNDEEFKKACLFQPDFVQSDNIPMMEFYKKMKK